jgi:FkbM family methyltransferase
MSALPIWEQFRSAREFFVAPRWTKARKIAHRLLLSRIASGTGVPVPVKCRTFWGGSFVGVLPDPVSTSIYCYGFFDPEVTEMVISCLRAGDTVIDVGAHFGFVSLLSAQLVGPSGHVHSFEPTPATYEVLKRNAALADGRVEINQVAVSSRSGEQVVLTDFGPGLSAFNTLGVGRLAPAQGSSRRREAVCVTTKALDDYCSERSLRPSVIKIDAEGAEQEVLDGARETIEQCMPTLILEVGDHRYIPLVDALLRSHPYDLWVRGPEGELQKTGDVSEAARHKDVVLRAQ